MGYAGILVILAPRVLALHAAEEPDLALVGGSQLAHPPLGRVVTAVGAPYVDGGKGPCLLGVIHDGDLLLQPLGCLHHPLVALDVADVAASPALQLTAGRDHEALAMWAEHHPV
jgi:hypothetical protein